MATEQTGLLIFDGDCGFCTSSARWVAKRWVPGPKAVAWQHLGAEGLAELGLTVEQAREAAWWVDGTGRLFAGHRAVAMSLAACTGWERTAGLLISRPPLSPLAAVIYRLVTRYRYRLPGGTPACRVTDR